MPTGNDFKTKSDVTRHKPKVKDVKVEVLKLKKREKISRLFEH